MSFNNPTGGAGLSFGFDVDTASITAAEQGINRVAQATDTLSMSQQGLQRSFTQGQSVIQQNIGSMQQYGQQLQTVTQGQQQFQQVQQQQISILNGAGTEVQKTAQQYTSYNDAVGGMQKQLAIANKDIGEQTTLQENLAGTSQTTFEKIQQLGQGFGMAAGSITGLIFSTYSLQRAQFTLHRTELQLESIQNKMGDQARKLEAATLKYGAASSEVKAIKDDMALTEQKYTLFQERQILVQENYSRQLLVFATTTGPLVISTVSSLFQGITAIGQVMKISRNDVMNWISAWGGTAAIGAGIGAVAIALGMFVLKVQETQRQLDQLKLELEALPEGSAAAFDKMTQAADTFLNSWTGTWAKIVKTAVPFNLQGALGKESMFATSVEQLKGGVVSAENTKIFTDVRRSLIQSFNDNFANHPDMKLLGIYPESAQKQILGNLSKIFDFVRNDSNWIDKANSEFTLNAIEPLAKKVETSLAGIGKLIATPGQLDVTSFILGDLNSPEIAAGANRIIELARGAVMAGTPIKDLTKWIDTFALSLANSKVFAIEDIDRVKELATAHLTAISPLTNLDDKQKEANKTTADAAKEEEKLNQILIENQRVQEARGQEIIKNVTAKALETNQLRALAGEYLGLNLAQSNNFELLDKFAPLEEARRKALDQENVSLLQLGKTYGVNSNLLAGNISILEDENGVMVDSKDTMMQKNQAIKDAIVSEGDYYRVLNNSTESEYARKDAVFQTVLAVIKQNDAIQLANVLWEDIDATTSQVITNYQQVALAAIDVTQALTNQAKGQYLVNQGMIEGKLAAQKFLDTTIQTTAKNQQYGQSLMEIANQLQVTSKTTLGDLIPSYIQLTNTELETLIKTFKETGHVGEALADVMNKRMAPAFETFNGIVAGMKDSEFRDAFKEIDFGDLNKEAWKDIKNMAKDMEDLATEGTQMLNVINALIIGVNNDSLKNSTLRQGLDEFAESLQSVIDIDPDGKALQPFVRFLDDLNKEDRKAVISLLGDDLQYLATAIADKDLTPEEVIAFYERLGLTSNASSEQIKAAVENLKSSAEILHTGLGAIIDPNQGRKESPEESKTRFFKGSIAADELIKAVDDPAKQIEKLAKQIAVDLQGVQTAAKNMSDQVSNSMSILVKNMKPHTTTVTTYLQTMQTAFANLANQGGNSLAILVNSAKAHVTTLATYFGTTLPDAIQKSVEAFVRLALAQQFAGGGGTTGGGQFQNVAIPFIGPGIGDVEKGLDWLSKQDIMGGLTGEIWNRQYRARESLIRDEKVGEKVISAAGGFSAAEGGITFGKGTGLGGITKGGAGDPSLDVMNRQIDQVKANLKALAATSSSVMTGLKNNLNVGYVAAGHLQTGLANLANEGLKSLAQLAKASSTLVSGLRNNLNVGYVSAGHLQVGLANLANEGLASLAQLAKASSTQMSGMRRNLNVGYVSAGHLQEGLANLSNEGSDSLSALAKASSTQMNGMRKNFNVGYSAADHLQTGIANLANEGAKSLKALARASSTQMNGFVNNIEEGTKAVKALKSAISSLSSKTITVTAKKAGDGWAFVGGGSDALGGIHLTSAQAGRISMTNGPELVLIGDNPGGHEIHAMIPMNNPLPTLRSLKKVLGSKGIASGGSSNVDSPGGGDGGGTEIINLNMDGEKMMTWIRRKLMRNRQGS